MKGKRINKSEKILGSLLAINDHFHVAILFEDALNSLNSNKYNLNSSFTEGVSYIPSPKGSATKQNINGKFIRKIPEEKTSKRVHISFVRKKDGAHIEFDRNYNVYVKTLQHKFEIEFRYVVNKHGQKLLVSPMLAYNNTNETNSKNTHTINLFLEIFGEYEIYTSDLEPALKFTNRYEFDLLPKGIVEDDDITYLVEGARRFTKKENEVQAFHKRLKIIQEYNPQIIGKGPNGFFGYIVFGFENLGVVLLESMYLGNATYIFNFENYESLIPKNKQEVLVNHLEKMRFFHNDNWEFKIRQFLSSQLDKVA